MRADPKIVPVSRIPYASNESRDRTFRVVRELEAQGAIRPEWTSTGRGYLSVPEWETVRAALAG